MKIEEIQIDDYVMFNGSIYQVEEISKKGWVHLIYNGIRVNMSSDYIIDMLEGVPLTPEILEKNGFEKVYDKYQLPNYRIKWNSYTDLYFTVFTGVDGYWNPRGLNVITGNIPATADYVHQLQHALRLCEIDKTIEL